MLDRAMKLAVTAAAVAVVVFFSLASYVVWQARAIPLHVNGVLTRFEGVESKMNATATHLDDATKAWADSAKEQAQAATDLAAQGKAALVQAQATLGEAHTALAGVSGEVEDLRGTTRAATGLVETATRAVDQLNDPATGVRPLMANANGAVTDLRGFFARNQQAAAAMMANGAALSGSVASIGATTDQVTKKAAQSYLHPSRNPVKRVWQAASPFLVAGAKVFATVF